MRLEVFNANSSQEIDLAFAQFAPHRLDVLFVASSAFLTSRRIQLVHLATRHAIPVAYPGRQYVDVGGLISYGANLLDAWRQAGIYTGRILNGAKPADLPVLQSSKLELIMRPGRLPSRRRLCRPCSQRRKAK